MKTFAQCAKECKAIAKHCFFSNNRQDEQAKNKRKAERLALRFRNGDK